MVSPGVVMTFCSRFFGGRGKPAESPLREVSFSSEGVPKYNGVIKILKEKYRGHKIFDDQNVGSHKMTTDSAFILFKKTDFNTVTILACLGGKVYRWWGGHKNLLSK